MGEPAILWHRLVRSKHHQNGMLGSDIWLLIDSQTYVKGSEQLATHCTCQCDWERSRHQRHPMSRFNQAAGSISICMHGVGVQEHAACLAGRAATDQQCGWWQQCPKAENRNNQNCRPRGFVVTAKCVPMPRAAPALLERPAWSDEDGNPVALSRPPHETRHFGWQLAVSTATSANGWQYASVFKCAC